MREILFKAKRIDNGEWVEGFLVKRDMIDEWYILTDIYEQITNGQRYMRSDIMTYAFRVKPETVCQYTGLTDKNGVKIFESDIVKIFSGKSYESQPVIEFYKGIWIARYEFGLDFLANVLENIEITGNIHDKEEQ